MGSVIQFMVLGVGILWLAGKIKLPGLPAPGSPESPESPPDVTRDPNTGQPVVPRAQTIIGRSVDSTPALRSGSGMQVNVDFEHLGPSMAVYLKVEVYKRGFAFFPSIITAVLEDDGQWVGDDAVYTRYRASLNRPLDVPSGLYDLKIILLGENGVHNWESYRNNAVIVEF